MFFLYTYAFMNCGTSGFLETEREGLLGKIIKYLDNASNSLIEYHFTPTDKQIRTNLNLYFCDNELRTIFNQVHTCSIFEKSIINHIFLTDWKIRQIYYYLQTWKNVYFNGENMDNFLGGLLKKIRIRRKHTLQRIAFKWREKLPLELIRKLSEFMDSPDKNYFIT